MRRRAAGLAAATGPLLLAALAVTLATGDEEGRAIDAPATERKRPPLDARIPAELETATFALG